MAKAKSRKPEGLDTIAQETDRIPRVAFERERGVVGVSGETGYYHVAAMTGGEEDRMAHELTAFNALTDAGVSLTMIKYHAHSVSFVMRAMHHEKAVAVIKGLGFGCRSEGPMGILTVHASDMRELSGVMLKTSEALMSVGAPIVQLGDSHRALYVLMPEGKLADAIAATRTVFGVEGAVE
jgi:aspartokinase